MNAKPFLFDTTFDAPEDVAAAAAAEPPPEPQFSQAELEEARNAAYGEGVAAGQAEAAAQFDQHADQLLRHIADQLGACIAAAETTQAETSSLLPTMTVATVKKAFPALAVNHGEDEILTLVRTGLQSAMDEPRIVVRLSDDDYENLEPQLGALPAQSGFPGKLVTLSDMTISPGDARVEWADGGMIRDLNRITDSIADALSALSHTADAEDFGGTETNDIPDTPLTENDREGAMTHE